MMLHLYEGDLRRLADASIWKKMKKEIALVDGEYLLMKFPGKGGWTYAEIPEVFQNRDNPFGWVKVKGSIDNYELRQHKLMPIFRKG